MSHLVFLVHGMGIHETGWESKYIDALNAVYGRYGFLAKKKLTDRFTFVPIGYDDVFRETVANWALGATAFEAEAQKAGLSSTRLTSWLKGADAVDNNFKWTHAADVLMYKLFSLVRERVCVRVANQMVAALQEQIDKEGESRWSVMAHSLGTAVLHDTLARLWDKNSTLPGRDAFSACNTQAQVIAMIANVSRLLETKTDSEPYDTYETPVMPGSVGQEGRGCMYYFNARHKLDPFTVPKMFDPQVWPDAQALLEEPPLYTHVEVEHVHQWNVHDIGHYLDHPDVHVPLLRLLTDPTSISDKEYAQARADFKPFGTLQTDAAVRVRQKLEDAMAAQSSDWLVLGKVWQAFIGKGEKGGLA